MKGVEISYACYPYADQKTNKFLNVNSQFHMRGVFGVSISKLGICWPYSGLFG